VKLADVDMDGWLDVIFSTTLSDGDPRPSATRASTATWATTARAPGRA
jgi:hypothetical protein